MDLQLKGKAAVVTGGTRGIGRAIAEGFADEGANVAICARKGDEVEAAVKALEAKGVKAFGQVVDITSTDDTPVKAHFQATKDYADVEDQLGQALKEVEATACGQATFRLIKHYNLDRAIFANVRTSGDNLVLDLALVDLPSHKRVAHRKNSFEGEDPQNLSREVNRLVAGLLADADDRPKASSGGSKDPLDSIDGMEGWDEDKGGSRSSSDDDDRPKKKKKAAEDE